MFNRTKFIEDLSRESIAGAQHDWSRREAQRGPKPVLSDGIHSLLASWAVAFFLPRGIRVYAAQNGRRVIPPPMDHNRRGYSRADEYSSDDYSGSEDSSWSEEEEEARRQDMYLPRRERALRSQERERERRRDRRRRALKKRIRGTMDGDWEIHFVSSTPTVWQPGARPRTYGEPAVRARR